MSSSINEADCEAIEPDLSGEFGNNVRIEVIDEPVIFQREELQMSSIVSSFYY